MIPDAFTLSCIIPAHNEAARIGAVLAAVSRHPMICEVIVVDDASADATARVAADFPGVQVIRHIRNGGKTAALLTGIRASRGTHLMFLDADLDGLAPADLTALIAPVRQGRVAASLSLRGNAPGLWRILGLDYISGERVMARASLPGDLSSLAHLPGFGFEVALNRRWIAAGLPVAVVPWPGVQSPVKARKHGWRAGITGDLRMLRDIFRTVGLQGAVSQILGLRRLTRHVAKPSSNLRRSFTLRD